MKISLPRAAAVAAALMSIAILAPMHAQAQPALVASSRADAGYLGDSGALAADKHRIVMEALIKNFPAVKKIAGRTTDADKVLNAALLVPGVSSQAKAVMREVLAPGVASGGLPPTRDCAALLAQFRHDAPLKDGNADVWIGYIAREQNLKSRGCDAWPKVTGDAILLVKAGSATIYSPTWVSNTAPVMLNIPGIIAADVGGFMNGGWKGGIKASACELVSQLIDLMF